MGIDDERPHIEYPCSWAYRVIGESEDALRACVAGIVGGEPHELTKSQESRTGRYVSLVLTLTVRDEEHRLGVYHRLAEHAAVRMVL